MHTAKSRRYLLEDLEIDKAINGKQFGIINIVGETKMCMFPLEDQKGDVVAILRGLKFPCVLREVDLGKYEWIGGVYVNTLWDCDFLEKQDGESGGVEKLEIILLV